MVERRVQRKGLRPRVAASVIALLWVIAIVIFGIVEHLVDEQSFDTVWDGMWWATQTVTTVGYGDIVPEDTAGQVIAAVLMIGGLSLFARDHRRDHEHVRDRGPGAPRRPGSGDRAARAA